MDQTLNGIKKDREMFQETNNHEGGNSYVDTSFIRHKDYFRRYDL